ncbi:hypothetical protein KZP23_13615 [Echinicola marina]|uniref:hypothetical protein n=1 Tax=Echinicola marina TaxID=2859768 RepID=UPI001CF6E570|nr:hypothetical protein [Echinicola marina]UCS91775.1 hypothetical protein KZP23_13615 [Echinicola marina]
MEHRYYIKSRGQQIQIQFLIGFAALLLVLLVFWVSWSTGIYLIGVLVFTIVLSIIAPFFDVPSLRESGKLRYHSLLFLSEKPKNGIVQIHGGTLFDYVFVIDGKLHGKERQRLIIQQYLEGLLHLIEEIESQQSDDMIIRGTSYIINERTARKMGFKTVKTDFLQKLILLYNFFNVLISASIAKGRFTLPKLRDTRTFEASLHELVKRKVYISNLNEKFKNVLAHTL